MKLKISVALLAFVTAVIPLSLFAEDGLAHAIASRDAAQTYANLPLRFEPAAEQGHFLARSSGYAVLVGAGESTIAITDGKAGLTRALRFSFDGSNAKARIEAIEALPGVTNYYIGADPKNWRLGVRNFAKLRTKDVYPGVDIVYYGDHRRLEFDFVVAPAADPRAIAMALSGMDKLYINAEGELVAEINGTPVRFAKPYAYQKVAGNAKAVSVEYALAGPGKVQLQIGDYDKNLELVIDPTLTYSTYLGGTAGDYANGIALDTNGNAYITGETCSIGVDANPIVFPSGSPNTTGTTPNGVLTSSGSTCNAYVTKLDPTGATVLFTTFIVGTATNETGFASGNGIALDQVSLHPTVPIVPNGNANPNVYIVGTTSFPDLPGAGNYNGGDSDAFVMILDSNSGALIRSTYLGGGRADAGYAVAVDPQQNVIVVGQTNSNDFPVYNGFEPKTEDYVAFVTKLDFGLHIAKPSATLPLLFGASAMTPRANSATDACGSPPATCPAIPNAAQTYYFFSALFGGQLVTPIPTWPVNNGSYPVTPALVGSAPPPPCTAPGVPAGCYGGYVAVPQGAITVGTPYCPTLQSQTNYPAQVLLALGSGLAEGLNWGNCSSYTVNSAVPDYGGFNWLILGPAPPNGPSPVEATTEAYGVALDPVGDVFVVGGSDTASLQPLNLLYPCCHYAGTGAWIIKILGRDTHTGSRDAGAPVYMTPLGTSATDLTQTVNAARGITVDSQGRAYVVGTATGNIYTTTGSLHPSVIGAQDAFILRMNTAGSGIDYSTYLGGTQNDQGLAVAIDAGNYAYVVGSTQSTDIPVINAVVVGTNTLSTLNNPQHQEAYIAKITPDGTALEMSAYLGGSRGDQANAVALSLSGNGDIYLAGNTNSTDFPVVPLDSPTNHVVGRTAYAGSGDGFVTKISGASFPKITLSPTGGLSFPTQAVLTGSTVAQMQTVTLTNSGTATLHFLSPPLGPGIGMTAPSDFSLSANTCGTQLNAGSSCAVTVTFTPSQAGTRTGTLQIPDDATNSPQDVPLTGNGVLVSDSVSPATLSFASTPVNTTNATAQTVTLTNTDANFTLIPASLVQPANTDFAVPANLNTCVNNLLPGQSCTMGVTFTPSAPGTRSGTLIVNTGNGDSLPPVTLTGIGSGTSSATPTGTGCSATDICLTGPTSAVSVTKGTPATFNINVTIPSGFTGSSISLTCAPPANVTCTISPNPIPVVSGTTTYQAAVTVSVPAGNTITIGSLIRSGRLLAMLLPFGGIGLVFAGRRKRWLLVLGLLVCLALGMVACGGGSGGNSANSNQQQLTITTTPAGGQVVVPLAMQ